MLNIYVTLDGGVPVCIEDDEGTLLVTLELPERDSLHFQIDDVEDAEQLGRAILHAAARFREQGG